MGRLGWFWIERLFCEQAFATLSSATADSGTHVRWQEAAADPQPVHSGKKTRFPRFLLMDEGTFHFGLFGLERGSLLWDQLVQLAEGLSRFGRGQVLSRIA